MSRPLVGRPRPKTRAAFFFGAESAIVAFAPKAPAVTTLNQSPPRPGFSSQAVARTWWSICRGRVYAA